MRASVAGLFTVVVCLASLAVGRPGVVEAQSAQAPTPAAAEALPTPLAPDAPFTVACARAVLETGPILVTKEGPFGPRMQYIDGGVRTLRNGGAHAAGNATSQMLVVLRDNPKVRLLFTMADGLYRIVAKRSAGIRTIADLKGKRVVTPQTTSANYFLVAMLRTAGLQESDVTIVTRPATEMAAALVRGDADAISMWEPESQNAVVALGADAIIFQDNKAYRELYSIYSTTDVMQDPRRRAELVDFVRALLVSVEAIRKDPPRYFPLISKVTGHPVPQIARSWEHHAWPVGHPADLLDKLVEEDQWIAARQKRAPRSRTELAGYIDTSILAEARRPRP
jgi:NitT/TauT family transport system substrate-binding protein